jgi:hypothetical protein
MYKRLKYYSGFGTTVGFCYELVCDNTEIEMEYNLYYYLKNQHNNNLFTYLKKKKK